MSFSVNWSLLDESVSNALREFLNAKLELLLKKRALELQHKDDEKQQTREKRLFDLLPSSSMSVTKLWFGSAGEAPLLEILDINIVELPLLVDRSDSALTPHLARSLNNTVGGSHSSLSIMRPQLISPLSTIPAVVGSSSSVVSSSILASPPVTSVASPNTSIPPASSSSTTVAAVGMSSVSANSTAANQSFATAATSFRIAPRGGSDESLSQKTDSGNTMSFASAPTASGKAAKKQVPPLAAVLPQQRQQQQQSTVMLASPQPPRTVAEAALGPRGAVQIRLHIVCNNHAGFELATESKLEVKIFGSSDCKIVASLPVLFTVSNFQFDLVVVITFRPDGGSKIEIEGDRFAGVAAARSSDNQQQAIAGASTITSADHILSSMSVVVKIGEADEATALVDAEHVRKLALKEIRALLAQLCSNPSESSFAFVSK